MDSVRAVREALRLARRDGARVTVVVSSPTVAAAARARGGLPSFLKQFPDDGVEIDGHAVQGHPAARLPEVAQELGADLVLVAATRKGALERFAVGSTAEALVRECPLPVRVVGPELVSLRHVLVGVGYTKQCKLALRAGYVDAFRERGRLEVVHVGQSAGRSAVRSDATVESGLRALHEGEAALRTYLALSIPREIRGQSVEARHLVGWQAAQAIIKRAREIDASLVVLGRHRRTLRRLLLGATGERVMRAVPCSLLVVGDPQA